MVKKTEQYKTSGLRHCGFGPCLIECIQLGIVVEDLRGVKGLLEVNKSSPALWTKYGTWVNAAILSVD